MGPIRIGILGLSASGSWASGAHLPYLKQTSKYKITALCNSTVEAAREAIKKYDLPAETKAYGSPEDLAQDPDIDLVVCTVRVDRHLETVRPALEAGKHVYCEWPLGANLAQAEELAVLAQRKGVRTMVGLQARKSPVIHKIKELVDNGTIGRVLSSNVVSSAGNFGPSEGQKLKYFNDRKIGGNMLTIHFGHMVDYVLYALGDLDKYSGLLSTQRRKIHILDQDKNPTEVVTRDTPDHIILQGQLKSGGVLSIHQRGGAPFKGQPGLIWKIYGDKGEIMVTADGSFLQIGYPNMNISVHDFADDSVSDISWETPVIEDVSYGELPLPARNVARLYEAFAAGKSDEYVQMTEAVIRHRLLDDLYKQNGLSDS